MVDDWPLIEASIAQQYGIRMQEEFRKPESQKMQWREFCTLISALNDQTPFGAVVAIRAERDPKKIREFSAEQRRIHNEWKHGHTESYTVSVEEMERDMANLAKMFST